MDSKYGWEQLQKVGDFMVVEGKTARQVSPLAKTFVERHVSPEALVSAISTPDGNTVVFLAYLPPRPESPAPQPDVADSPRKTASERVADQRRSRDLEALERRNEVVESGVRGRATIAKHVEGYEPWDGK